VQVRLAAQVLGEGVGRSKRAAERDAAEHAQKHPLLNDDIAVPTLSSPTGESA
jgi:hypothetical protein